MISKKQKDSLFLDLQLSQWDMTKTTSYRDKSERRWHLWRFEPPVSQKTKELDHTADSYRNRNN